MSKTHATAAVIIPPREVWRPIQLLRARYDSKIARWMPHLTMAYPFRPREEFDALAPALAEALKGVQPFTLDFSQFFYFEHGRERYTLWLSPDPVGPLRTMAEAIARVVPDCSDVYSYEFGFTPHLSVGQVNGRAQMEKLRASLQSSWEPLSFRVAELSLIWREDTPDAVFRVGTTVALASP